MWSVLRAKFYAPNHRLMLRAVASHVTISGGRVRVDVWQSVGNNGNIPERGTLTWYVRDSRGKSHAHGSRTIVLYPGRSMTFMIHGASIGSPSGLPAGTYTVTMTFVGAGVRVTSAPRKFRQPF